MVKILRGDIFWADFNLTQRKEQSGHRPVLVVSHDIFNLRSGTVIAMALTSQKQKAEFPLTFKLEKNRLSKDAWVKISQIRVLSTERFGKKIGKITSEKLDKVIEGLNEIIG